MKLQAECLWQLYKAQLQLRVELLHVPNSPIQNNTFSLQNVPINAFAINKIYAHKSELYGWKEKRDFR